MRDPEQQRIALDCLKLADGDVVSAQAMLHFVMGARLAEAEAAAQDKAADVPEVSSRPDEAAPPPFTPAQEARIAAILRTILKGIAQRLGRSAYNDAYYSAENAIDSAYDVLGLPIPEELDAI